MPISQGATGSWALKADGTLNWPLITYFASAGMHDMSVAGKAVTLAFYAHATAYSYFYGCSTGGREGLMEAQRYPADYNGIVSGALAINWTKFIPAEIWPQLVMNQSTHSAGLQGRRLHPGGDQGLRARPGRPGLDQQPGRLPLEPLQARRPEDAVRHHHPGGRRGHGQDLDGPVTVQGKKLWYGLERGASLAGLAGTATSAAWVTTGVPFPSLSPGSGCGCSATLSRGPRRR